MTPLLDVQHLTVTFDGPGAAFTAVDDVSLHDRRRRDAGARRRIGQRQVGHGVLHPAAAAAARPRDSGRILFEGRDLLSLSEAEMRPVRGARISLIFQEPMTALNPVMRVGDQIAEALTVHGMAGRAMPTGGRSSCSTPSGFRTPARRVRDYPHQLSGGMRQRVMIAIALACRPPLVIADEPTTALDVTIQAQVLDLLRELKERFNLALLLITHDFGVIAEMADRVAVMYGGRLVEEGPVRQILRTPSARLHPPPARRGPGDEPALMPLLEVRHLVKHFSRGGDSSGLRRSSFAPWTMSASRSTKARCSVSSASREAARARPAAASSA